MTTIKIVTESYIKSITPMSLNVDMKDITPNIIPAQDLYVQPLLGTNLYNQILLAYSGATLSENQITLLNLLQPVAANYALDLTIPFLVWQIKNKGPQSQFGDYSSAIGLDEFSYLRNEIKNRGEYYSQRVIAYLCENSSEFPLYQNNTNTDVQPTTNTVYDSGIAFYPTCGINNCGCGNHYYH